MMKNPDIEATRDFLRSDKVTALWRKLMVAWDWQVVTNPSPSRFSHYARWLGSKTAPALVTHENLDK